MIDTQNTLLKDRFFLWKIIHPFNEFIKSINGELPRIFFDNLYSPLQYQIENLCIAALSLFEMEIFSQEIDSKTRNTLKKKHPELHRILSFGIKAKHGTVTNPNYTNVNLTIPLCVFYFPEFSKYDYGYSPILKENGIEAHFIEDFKKVALILHTEFKIQFPFPKFEVFKPSLEIIDSSIQIPVLDIYSFFGYEKSANIRTFKINSQIIEPSDLPFEIQYAIFDKKTDK